MPVTNSPTVDMDQEDPNNPGQYNDDDLAYLPEVVGPNARPYPIPPEYQPRLQDYMMPPSALQKPRGPDMSSEMWAELKDFIGPGGGPMIDPRAGPVIDPREGIADLPPFGGGRGEPPSRYGAPQPGDAGDQGIGQPTPPGLQYHDYNPMGPERGGDPGPDDESVQQLIQRFFNAPEQAWEGKSVPTQRDIDTIREQPTDSVLESFEQKFGEGSTGKYLNPGK